MRVEIITIGDEICRGEILNTNANWLAEKIWEQRLTVTRITTCLDIESDIRECILQAVSQNNLVIISGGLGPTLDDCTVDAVNTCIGNISVVHQESLKKMAERFSQMGIPLLENAKRQVRIPKNAIPYINPKGFAPAFEVEMGKAKIIVLPGPPRELQAIYTEHLVQRIAILHASMEGEREYLRTNIFRVFGKSESRIATELKNLVLPNKCSLHFQVKFPETLVKLVVLSHSEVLAKQTLDSLSAHVQEALGNSIYGEGSKKLPQLIGDLLRFHKQTIATAESCTAGLIGSILTEEPGATDYYAGGAITYSNAEKTRQLGVPKVLLQTYGAVSKEVVEAMAIGIRTRVGSDWGLSVSGIAGPDGGSKDKPVGTVCIAVAGPQNILYTREYHWPGDRQQIRELAVFAVLIALKRELQKAFGE